MRNATRLAFTSMLTRIGQLSGVSDVSKEFSVDPVPAQALYEKVQLSSAFLTEINMVTVPQQVGQKVGIVITRPVAGRTDTSGGTRRNPGNPTDTIGRGYRCEKTNFDTAMSYALMDAWAHRPEYQTLVRDAIATRQGLDRMIIGWNGTSVAATTDPVAHPLLQDVNKGWIQNVREQADEQIISHGDLDANHIYVSADGAADYKNIDALVYELVETLEEPFRDDTGLVAICGRSLVHDKYFDIYDNANSALEAVNRDILVATRKLGGLPAVRVPYFPANSVVVTRLDNLSIYDQEGSQRRMIWEQPDLDRVCDFQSVNEAYVVEENGLFAMAENIQLGAKA